MAACSDADGPMWRGMKPSRASSWVRLVRVMMGTEKVIELPAGRLALAGG
jgi:hypothetical protein